MKKMDTVDTVRPSSPTHFYRMKILDSVRFDTVTPRYMEMTQGSDDIPLDYCYVYEAYFDKPIVVDSDFYLYGTTNITRVTEGGQDYPMYKVLEYAQVITLVRKRSSAECQDVSESDPDGMPNICPTEGHWNTMTYYGYADFSIYGYPITGQPWAMNDYIFPNDPFGFYLAIVENYKLEVNTEDSTKGVGVGGGIYYNSDGTEIQAVPNAGYRFIHWNDGSTENPRTVYLTQDTVFTAYFDTATYYNVETAVNHEYWGVVTGGGAYAVNTEVELEAVPAGGFMFEQWGDGDTQNPRTVTVTQDTLFTAVFSLDTTPTGIPEAGRLAFGIAPNPTGGRLTVTLNESSPCEAEVYDATGRCVLRATLQGPQSDLDVRRLPAGRHTLRLTCGNKTGVRTFVKN
ncbi:MAG: T9SS type A sorting domain-containing protein [Bacteroidales bacterium]|nr:T9SS type A sorting domain-containing protein [Bacteroidales bacterium]